jgi:hypothetical protein
MDASLHSSAGYACWTKRRWRNCWSAKVRLSSTGRRCLLHLASVRQASWYHFFFALFCIELRSAVLAYIEVIQHSFTLALRPPCSYCLLFLTPCDWITPLGSRSSRTPCVVLLPPAMFHIGTAAPHSPYLFFPPAMPHTPLEEWIWRNSHARNVEAALIWAWRWHFQHRKERGYSGIMSTAGKERWGAAERGGDTDVRTALSR